MNLIEIGSKLVEFAELNKDQWNQLDAAQGDGDLGVTIVLGARALAESAAASESLEEWLMQGGKALRKAAPSTMGILIASALIAAGKALKAKQMTELDARHWGYLQQCMIKEIQERGGAKLGDKTLLDAFIPAEKIFTEDAYEGKNLDECLRAATVAAKEAAELTATMISKIGRSSWLGERAQGTVDGGAWVCYQTYEFLSKQFPGETDLS